MIALNSLVVVQTKPTIETAKQINRFLNYRATHPDAITEYRKSGMILHIYSDESYILLPEARIRSVGYSPLGPKSNTPIHHILPNNGPVHIECIIMINIMTSATEEELGGLFEKCQKSTSMRT